MWKILLIVSIANCLLFSRRNANQGNCIGEWKLWQLQMRTHFFQFPILIRSMVFTYLCLSISILYINEGFVACHSQICVVFEFSFFSYRIVRMHTRDTMILIGTRFVHSFAFAFVSDSSFIIRKNPFTKNTNFIFIFHEEQKFFIQINANHDRSKSVEWRHWRNKNKQKQIYIFIDSSRHCMQTGELINMQ